MIGTPRAAPLHGVDLARPVRVQRVEGRLETSRHQQVLEVRVAAVVQEGDDLLVVGDLCVVDP